MEIVEDIDVDVNKSSDFNEGEENVVEMEEEIEELGEKEKQKEKEKDNKSPRQTQQRSFNQRTLEKERENIDDKEEENDNEKEYDNESVKINDKMTWRVIEKYFEDNPNNLVAHHLESYNDFIGKGIKQIIQQNNPVRFQNPTIQNNACKLYIGGKDGNKIYIGKPVIYDTIFNNTQYMYPNDARLRNMTYGLTIHYDVDVEFEGQEPITLKQIYLGKFPIMLQSNYCILNQMSRDVRYSMGECRNDFGGYFIIDGKEKVIVSQEKFADNQIAVITNKVDPLLDEDGGATDSSLNATEYVLCYAKVKSVAEDASKPKRTVKVMIMAPTKNKPNRQIVVDIPNVKEPIPLFIVMRALGVISDKDIIETCLLDLEKNQSYIDLFIPSIHHSNKYEIFTQVDAINFIHTQLRIQQRVKSTLEVMKILCDSFLPHIGEMNFLDKAYYLGYMVYRLLRVYTKVDPDTNVDEYNYKRVETSGTMLYDLFSDYYKDQVKEIEVTIERLYRAIANESQNKNVVQIDFKTFFDDNQNVIAIFKKRIVEGGIMKAFKGDWGATSFSKRIGILQDLNRISWSTHISHLRKLSLPLDSQSRVVGPRLLTNSQWGLLDPVDAPDGASVGLDKHFSVLTRVSTFISATHVKEWLRKHGNISLLTECDNPKYISTLVKIFINGAWFALTKKPLQLIDLFKLHRRNNHPDIHQDISIMFDYKDSIHIQTDAGRLMRPLFVVDREVGFVYEKLYAFKSKMTWYTLVHGLQSSHHGDKAESERSESEGHDKAMKKTMCAIEYLDTQEQLSALIARNYTDLMKQTDLKHKTRYTHLEIDNSTILGVMGNLVIFPESNATARSTFSCSQSKQAVSVYHSNFQNRMDKMGVVLNYGQIPLVKSRYLNLFNKEELPYGVNTIVAIMSYTGYNVEDAILVNEGSLQRGLFRTTYFTTYEDFEESSSVKQNDAAGVDTRFMNVQDVSIERKIKLKESSDYSLLDKDGFIGENAPVTEKTVLMGKIVMDMERNKDGSILPKKGQVGYVDKVFVSSGEDGFRVAKVRVRDDRIPKIGDKLASRAGQKGTVGNIIPERDMPFTANGVRPDLILNPHAFPKRMTVGQFIECLFGKACVNHGAFGEGTAFKNKGYNLDLFGEMLAEQGYHSSGNEVMYDAITGEQLDADIFIGPTYYMRLKHMVQDKINYRATGPNQSLTRQPLEGRANDGGLKIGEMERDSLIGHGMAKFLNESFMERSGKDQIYLAVCNKTGAIAIYNEEIDLFFSPFADGPVRFKDENNLLLQGDKATFYLENVSRFGRSFSIVKVPYTFKLLMHELQVMNIQMRLITDDNVDQVLSLSYSNNIGKLLKEKETGKNKKELKDVIDNYLSKMNMNKAKLAATMEKKKALTFFTEDAMKPYYVKTLQDAGKLITDCFDYMNMNTNQEPIIDGGLPTVPVEANHGPWKINEDIAMKTMEYIFNKLKMNCYMLCVLDKSKVRLVKLVPQGYPSFLDENQLLPPELKNKDLRMFGCRLKIRNPKEEETFSEEINKWLHELNKTNISKLPVGLYILVLTDAVIVRKDRRLPWELRGIDSNAFLPSSYLPVFSFSGEKSSWDIPIPNMDDVNLVFHNDAELKSLKELSRMDFNTKFNKAVFRGNPTGCGVTEETNARIKLARMMMEENNREYLNAGIVSNSGGGYRYDNQLNIIENAQVKDINPVPKMDNVEQSRYKYIIHIDGNVAAYRLLKTMLFNSVILKVEGEFVLWYEHILNQGEIYMSPDELKNCHCLRIKPDLSNLIQTIQWCRENDDLCSIIAKNAVNFASQLLTKEYINDSMLKLLWASLQATDGETSTNIAGFQNVDWSNSSSQQSSSPNFQGSPRPMFQPTTPPYPPPNFQPTTPPYPPPNFQGQPSILALTPQGYVPATVVPPSNVTSKAGVNTAMEVIEEDNKDVPNDNREEKEKEDGEEGRDEKREDQQSGGNTKSQIKTIKL